MRHYILLKIKSEFSVTEVAENIRKILEPLQQELSGITSVSVSENCIQREDNLDISIEIAMRDKGTLDLWAEHPLHKALIAYAGPKSDGKYTIDIEN